MRAKPLHRRLWLWLMLSSVLPVMVLGLLALYREQTLGLAQAREDLQIQARFLAVHLDQFLQFHLTQAERTAEELQDHPSCRDFDCASARLARLRAAAPAFGGALLTDRDGVIIAASFENGLLPNRDAADGQRRVDDRSYFQIPRQTGQSYLSDAFPGRLRGDLIVTVSVPLQDEQGFAGIVQGALNLERVTGAMLRALAGEGRYSMVVYGRNGEPILRYPSDGPSQLSGFEEVKVSLDSGWRLHLGIDRQQVVEPARRLAVLLLIALSAALLSGLLVSRWLARRVSRPLEDLAAAVRNADLGSDAQVLHLPEPSGASTELQTIVGALHALGERLLEANAAQRRALGERDQALDSRDEYIRTQTGELQQALDAARVALRTRDQLVANTSHELRTPVAGLIGGLELLRAGELPAEVDAQLERLQQSAEHLLSVLNDLLDFQRTDAGNMTLKLAPMRLADEARTVIEGVSEMARKKGLQLQFEAGPGSGEMILGDAERFRQLLYNLLGNALKFTDHGGVQLYLWFRHGWVGCEVVDTGQGISAADRERIFEPFVQADGSASRRHGGTGLGLAICRRIVSGFGGDLTVDSEPGHGSRFRARWPATACRAAPSTPLPPAESVLAPLAASESRPVPRAADDNTPTRVLVVDDVDLNRELLQSMVVSLGAQADVAESGPDALRKLAEHHYDLVLLDVQMPGMDGYQTVSEIRRRGLAGGAWIVAVTASAQPRDQQMSLEAGMDDYRAKPLRMKGLRELLEQVRQRQARQFQP